MNREALSTLRRRLLGLLFVATMLGFVALSVAMYNKAFSTFTRVTLQAGEVGNQLQEQSDVKVRGLIVGTVQTIRPTRSGAELELALDPDKAHLIPSNASARLLPKTLFGERFVSLQIPNAPASESLSDGDVIPQDRSSNAIELEQAFERLLPVLQAVQPQKLSSTLTAISTALEGRGKPLGQTLSELGRYVGELNPHVPQLTHDLRALADASDTFSEAAPDFIKALDDLTVTSRTIAEQRSNLRTLYSTLTTSAQDMESFLAANKDNLIGFTKSSRPTFELLARYSPQTPCFLSGMAEATDRLNRAFGRGTDQPGLRAKIEFVNNRGKYEPGKDDPRYDDHRGPRCYDFGGATPPQHPPEGPIQDGSSKPTAPESGDFGVLPPAMGGGNNGEQSGTTSPSGAGTDGLGLANSPAERDVLATLLAPQLGMQPKQVPGWSSLLVGPLYRGAEVDIK
ncbi:MAG: MCE family protein [Pseudonocardiaceae bacterium]|nr:MCE family protein [Pseudonocardiaceae bacterium]